MHVQRMSIVTYRRAKGPGAPRGGFAAVRADLHDFFWGCITPRTLFAACGMQLLPGFPIKNENKTYRRAGQAKALEEQCRTDLVMPPLYE